MELTNIISKLQRNWNAPKQVLRGEIMYKILCSTGALLGKTKDRDYKLLKDLSQQLTCDGFEFMMYSSWYDEVEALIGRLKEMQLCIPVMHCEKHLGEAISKGEFDEAYRKFDINCHIAREAGAESIVVPLWDGITSDAHFENNINAYSQLKDIADQYGVKIWIENVVCNQEDPMKHWCELYGQFPDIQFVFDTKMASFHSQMELLYEQEYQWLWKDKHIAHYHINDYGGQYKEWDKLRSLPIGQGNIDFDKFFAFINQIGYRGTFTVESTAFDRNGVIDIDMLNQQFTFIRNAIDFVQFLL